MKVAVFSDSHDNNELMIEAVRRCRPDAIVHLGDHANDAEELRREYPEIPLYNVRGNCDLFSLTNAPDKAVITLGPVKAFITHGHLYHVDYNRVDSLVYAAQEQGCTLAMFGHTHSALHETVGGVTVVNPGTAGRGRRLTWAMLTIFDNGGIGVDINEL